MLLWLKPEGRLPSVPTGIQRLLVLQMIIPSRVPPGFMLEMAMYGRNRVPNWSEVAVLAGLSRADLWQSAPMGIP